MPEDNARWRFEESVPLYLNGTLPPAERAFVEQYLDQHPEAQRERVYWNELRAAMNEAANDAAPELGWAKLQQRMRGAANIAQQNAAAGYGAAPASSWWQRVADFLRPIATPQAFAAASVLVLVQAVALLSLLGQRGAEDEQVVTRSLGNRAQPAAIVSVKFAPSTSMDSFTQLLGELDARIIEGPIESGRYVIALRPAAKDKALAKLQASGIAQDVIALPAAEIKQ